MFKAFRIKKGSVVEKEVIKLAFVGRKYIYEFQEKLGILKFCWDLEVVFDSCSLFEGRKYIIFNVISDQVNGYHHKDLQESTIDNLKASITQGYSIADIGTNKLLQQFGYKSVPVTENLNKIELAL